MWRHYTSDPPCWTTWLWRHHPCDPPCWTTRLWRYHPCDPPCWTTRLWRHHPCDPPCWITSKHQPKGNDTWNCIIVFTLLKWWIFSLFVVEWIVSTGTIVCHVNISKMMFTVYRTVRVMEGKVTEEHRENTTGSVWHLVLSVAHRQVTHRVSEGRVWYPGWTNRARWPVSWWHDMSRVTMLIEGNTKVFVNSRLTLVSEFTTRTCYIYLQVLFL